MSNATVASTTSLASTSTAIRCFGGRVGAFSDSGTTTSCRTVPALFSGFRKNSALRLPSGPVRAGSSRSRRRARPTLRSWSRRRGRSCWAPRGRTRAGCISRASCRPGRERRRSCSWRATTATRGRSPPTPRGPTSRRCSKPRIRSRLQARCPCARASGISTCGRRAAGSRRPACRSCSTRVCTTSCRSPL